MSNYTPSLEEIESAWIEYNTEIPDDGAYLPMSVGQAEEQFRCALAEHDRQVAERAWDEAADIDAGCHDCIALGGYENPYRTEEESNG